MTLQEKIEKRVGLIAQARALLDKADQEKRDLSAEETTQYDALMADADKLEGEVNRELAFQKRSSVQFTLPGAASDTRIPLNPPGDGLDTRSKKTRPQDTEEYRSAFDSMVRRSVGQMSSDELRAMSVGSDPDGGFLVPMEYEKSLMNFLKDITIMRGICRTLSLTSDKTFPMVDSHGSAQWVDETGTYTDSDEKFKAFSVSSHKEGTVIKVSEELLKDSFIDLSGYISQEFARRFAVLEEAAFLNGNGVKKPLGIMKTTAVGYQTTSSATALTGDDLIELEHSLKPQYRNKATFVMTDGTVKALRKLKNSQGDYIWQSGLLAGAPNTLLTHPIAICETGNMPEVGSAATPILFGDFNYYWIIDRTGFYMQRLMELYALNGQVGFKGYKRVDGQCSLAEAFKLLKMKA